ncbi:MAG: GNAT family N-acetyltransferase [Candidatus Thiodiazotropha sp. (ex Codakia rugifera)]|nr:GNAT family N-acetyltransferase [Candidatus Thiodiazotropha sp. (ex Codakia rugifera)]
MIIREATHNDISAWSEMRTDLWPETGDMHVSEINEYFAGSSIDIVQAFIGTIELEPIGFLELNIRNFAEGSRRPKLPYVEAWYIKPRHRGNGYGILFMQQAEKWAVAKGYSELASDTEVENERSIAMHKYLDFIETERVVCFLKKLKNT